MPAAIAIPLIAAGVGAAGSAYAAKKQADASRHGADVQLQAANQASALENRSFDQAEEAALYDRGYNEWLRTSTAQARQPYLDALASSLGAGFGSYTPSNYQAPTYEAAKPFVAPNPNDISKTDAFQFELGQGVDAINRSGAARGTLLTGGTLKDATAFGQGLASTRYGEEYNRKLGEYQLGEQERGAAFDRNAANGFNAAQLNNQSQYQAASLAQSAYGQWLSSLAALAGMASPTGAYPGSTGTRPPNISPVDGSQNIQWQPGMQPSGGSDYDPNALRPSDGIDFPKQNASDPTKFPYGEPSNPWSGALLRRNV